MLEVIKIIASLVTASFWPIVVFLVVLIFRDPLREILKNFAERGGKASVGPTGATVELPAKQAELTSTAQLPAQVALPSPQRVESLPDRDEAPRRVRPAIEPPRRVVDPSTPGGYKTIRAAVEAAQPGERIIVREGTYEEGLTIDKPLEIVGEGDLNKILVRAVGRNVVLFTTILGRVANLTLQQAGGQWYAIDIAQGRLELEGCDITSEGLACVAIHGDATPLLRGNQIHDGKAGGVFVFENGGGVLAGNDIYGNALAGVEIREGGNPTLRRNQIHDGKAGGVFVQGNGQGVLEDNDIYGNAFAGVEIREGGNPTLRRNQIHDGKAGGVFVQQNGQGLLEDNDIYGNARAGVAISKGGNPTLRRNRVNKNGYEAIWIYEGGAGTIEDNDLRENIRGPWDVSDDSKSNVSAARNKE